MVGRVLTWRSRMISQQNFYYFEPFFINKRSFRSPWGKPIMKVDAKYYRLKKKKNFSFKKFACSQYLEHFFIILQHCVLPLTSHIARYTVIQCIIYANERKRAIKTLSLSFFLSHLSNLHMEQSSLLRKR